MKCTCLYIALGILVGCAEKIGQEKLDLDTEDSGQGSLPITIVENDDGTTSTLVDASNEDEWIYWSFSSSAALDVSEPESDLTWSLGFKRYNVKINGGVSGMGGMEVAVLEGYDFSVADGFDPLEHDLITDEIDEAELPDYALKDWYIYDFQTHVLSPAEYVYAIKSERGEWIKLKFDGYYDVAGSSGFPHFTWERI